MNIVPFNKVPSRAEAAGIIRKLVVEGKMSWTKHSKKRMAERGITTQQVLTCLLKGRIMEEPFLTHYNGGGYETVLERKVAGDHLRIVICLKLRQRILVISAIKCKKI